MMANKVNIGLLQSRYKSMLELQKEIKTQSGHWFPPTMRELQRKWSLATTSSVQLTLTHFRERNLLAVREKVKNNYFAIVKLKEAVRILGE